MLNVNRGQAIDCVIQNVRDMTPPPGPGQADLRVVKSARPAALRVGEQVTWTVTVTNTGPDIATNVVIEDSLPNDVSFVDGSLDVPDGVTCTARFARSHASPVNTSVTGRFVTTVTAVGRKTNTVTVKADQRDPNPADNAASAVVDVTGGAEEILSPILECVDQLSDGNYRAHFGYQNDGSETVSVPIGDRQRVHTGAGEPRPAAAVPARTRAGRLPGRLPQRHARVDAHRPHVDREHELEALRSGDWGSCGSTRSCARPTIRGGSTSRSTAFPPAPAATSATSARPATRRCRPDGTASARKVSAAPRWPTTTSRSSAAGTAAAAPSCPSTGAARSSSSTWLRDRRSCARSRTHAGPGRPCPRSRRRRAPPRPGPDRPDTTAATARAWKHRPRSAEVRRPPHRPYSAVWSPGPWSSPTTVR